MGSPRTYATDQDMMDVRSTISNLGVSDFDTQHVEAASIINRILEVRWYKDNAYEQGVDWTETPFDPELVDGTYVKRAATYKALELVYRFMMPDSPDPSAFEREANLFRDLFEDEMRTILATGLGYDWDASGGVDADERYQPRIRRLQRM